MTLLSSHCVAFLVCMLALGQLVSCKSHQRNADLPFGARLSGIRKPAAADPLKSAESGNRVKIVKFKRLPVMSNVVHLEYSPEVMQIISNNAEDHQKATSELVQVDDRHAEEVHHQEQPVKRVHLINFSQDVSDVAHPENGGHYALEMANRRPVMVDSMTALSHTYALPPLTAALPMDLLEKLAFDLAPQLSTQNHHLIQPAHQHQQPHQQQQHSRPSHNSHHQTYSIEPQEQSHIQPIRMVHQTLPGHLIREPEPILLSSAHSPIPSPSHHPHHHPQPEPQPPIRIHLEDRVPGIPGRAWKDYPMFATVPKTNFNCAATSYGYFADVESGCQVWHYCQPDGRHSSFLCPNGTVFNQRARVCDWWYNVHCASSIKLYGVNADLYQHSSAPETHKAELHGHSGHHELFSPDISHSVAESIINEDNNYEDLQSRSQLNNNNNHDENDSAKTGELDTSAA